MLSTPTSSQALVACNIYISAASSRPSHPATLLNLLRRAQDHCRRIRSGSDVIHNADKKTINPTTTAAKGETTRTLLCSPVVIVHAYADIPYDRSSIHLAGYSECVADVASQLIRNALSELEFNSFGGSDMTTSEKAETAKETITRISGTSTRHPTVGLIDHVSVMPLVLPPSISQLPLYTPFGNSLSPSTSPTAETENADQKKEKSVEAAAKVARQIGDNLSQYTNSNSLEIFYYGRACPKNTPLATVRRERTSYFNSGGIRKLQSDASAIKNGDEVKEMNNSSSLPKFGSMTIGTPQNFVENFNICLTSKCTRSMARMLTDMVRGRNAGGIVGVEALTLPYYRAKELCYEVACNLTNPNLGKREMILERIEVWVDLMRKQLLGERSDGVIDEEKINFDYFVQDAYRVGTTEVQCIDVLTMDDYTLNEDHDDEVFGKFKKLLYDG
mmetsp:Transcript_21886/g.43909  ORF Transcript_21886/g.43909 Transcript_21886/m.43909 type:complete len:446 (+) Transcript_21886:1-1338(+)